MRREFQLPATDESFLKTLGRPWETVADGSVRWLLIHDRVVPVGYTVTTVSEAYRIETGQGAPQVVRSLRRPHKPTFFIRNRPAFRFGFVRRVRRPPAITAQLALEAAGSKPSLTKSL